MATSCCQIEILRQAVAELKNDRTEQAKEILQQLVAEFPWGHNLLILNKIPDFPVRRYLALITDIMRLQRKPETGK